MTRKRLHIAELNDRRIFASAGEVCLVTRRPKNTGVKVIRIAIISSIALLSACVEMNQTQSTSVNGRQVYVQESNTQVSFIPGLGN